MKKIRIIPSKSDAHRAMICAALSKTPCQVLCRQTSEDIEGTRKCLEALCQGKEEMYCGESGSTLRFLLPLMGALNHKAAFHMEGRLPQRPLSPLYEELVRHGCVLSPQGGNPFVIEGRLQPGTFRLPGNVSSQFVSGLLFALPLLKGDSRILIGGELESRGYVDLTLKVLRDFGIKIEEISGEAGENAEGYVIKGGQEYAGPREYEVEGDWSNGTFWLAAGALLEEGICVTGLDPGSVQGDKKIVDLLMEFGAQIAEEGDGVSVSKGAMKGINIDASSIPDMVPALAVIASAASGTTEIKNAGRLRIKESDRLHSVTAVMSDLGADIRELSDGLVIKGTGTLKGGTVVNSFGDHRIAMMAAIASIICREKIVITDSDAVKKSYPGFFTDLSALGLDGKIERR